jgi:osmotically inducible protein OsmC
MDMTTSKAEAQWKGKIKEGQGSMKFTGYEGAYTFDSRFENGGGTNPEELIGAAHAGCYSMYLSLLLTEEGLNPESLDTKAEVTIASDDSGPHITQIKLDCKVKCQGLDEGKLKKLAATTKEKCPVSRLYAGGTAKISADAHLIK